MSAKPGPDIIRKGLVFHVHGAHPRCYSNVSTCRDLMNINGNGILTDVSLSSDQAFLFPSDLSQIKFTRNFTNITNQITYTVVIDVPLQNDFYSAFLTSTNNNYGGIYLGYYYAGINQYNISLQAYRDDGNEGISMDFIIPYELWKRRYIITATIDPSSVNLYIDGELKLKTTYTSYNFNNQNYIHLGYNDQVFEKANPGSKIYQASIYNRALSAGEVLQNYNALKTRYKI